LICSGRRHREIIPPLDKDVTDNFGRDDFYIVVIFKDYAARTDFLAKHGLVDNRYQDGPQLAFAIAQQAKAALTTDVRPEEGNGQA
jgi:hypothetical protein